jgi:hypothetical protein
LKIQDPETYPIDQKPCQVNIYAGGPQNHKAAGQNMAMHGQPPPPLSQPSTFPYAYYPQAFPFVPYYPPQQHLAPAAMQMAQVSSKTSFITLC